MNATALTTAPLVLCSECRTPLNDSAPLECHFCGAPICRDCAIVVQDGDGYRAMAKSHAEELYMKVGLI